MIIKLKQIFNEQIEFAEFKPKSYTHQLYTFLKKYQRTDSAGRFIMENCCLRYKSSKTYRSKYRTI